MGVWAGGGMASLWQAAPGIECKGRLLALAVHLGSLQGSSAPEGERWNVGRFVAHNSSNSEAAHWRDDAAALPHGFSIDGYCHHGMDLLPYNNPEAAHQRVDPVALPLHNSSNP